MRNPIDPMVTFRLKLWHYTIVNGIDSTEKIFQCIQQLIIDHSEFNLEMVREIKKSKINYRIFDWG